MNKEQKIINLVDDLFCEYDRLSSDGQEDLDKLAKLVGTDTNKEMMKKITEEIRTLKKVNISKGVAK
jgi:hypothetical protein|tara:strand:- start:782 stop:982 length:201 start_codon:yes stop_codon:yes gene_type:complete